MRVYVNRNPADRYNCPLREGETGNVSDDVGAALVKAGLAKCLDEPIKAVPVEPVIAKQKPIEAELKAPGKQETPTAPTRSSRSAKASKYSKSQPKNKDS